MPQTTVTYERSCIIDQKVFLTKRISAVYCSQKCRNKARSFPARLLEQLIAKHALTTIIHEGPPRSVVNYIRDNNLQLSPVANQNNPSDVRPDPTMSHVIPVSIQQDLIDNMKQEVTKRKIEQKIEITEDGIEFAKVKDDDLL